MHSFYYTYNVHVAIAAEALDKSRAVQCTIQVTRVAVFCLTESSTVRDFLLLTCTRRLAHGSGSFPTDSVDYDQAVSSRESNSRRLEPRINRNAVSLLYRG